MAEEEMALQQGLGTECSSRSVQAQGRGARGSGQGPKAQGRVECRAGSGVREEEGDNNGAECEPTVLKMLQEGQETSLKNYLALINSLRIAAIAEESIEIVKPKPPEKPKPPPSPRKLHVDLQLWGFCCCKCYSGRLGGPYDPCYGRPIYDSWCGYGSGSGETQPGCSIM
ncbi:hypothetical protein SLEP1_g26013 [Rubroshorea leprosula]|uniref:Uncharacterized protein n=1 Tax=Rubroshorea leprosula TaxID=152421 RepID=A0AAV5JS08_9ROSI|nr:hypothetical protein SLEP1_g26013 [Rubroshorea leprosula]